MNPIMCHLQLLLGNALPRLLFLYFFLREIEEFPEVAYSDIVTHYYNTLHVYPEYVHLSSKGVKNIGVKVQLKKDDNLQDIKGLKVTFFNLSIFFSLKSIIYILQ